MRTLSLILLCFLCCLFISCLTPVPPTTETFIPWDYVQLLQSSQAAQQAQQTKGLQYYAAVYQQWIILGVYVLTTLIMAFYTSKKDKKKVQNIKHAADALLRSRRGRPGLLFKFLQIFSKRPRK